MAVLIALLLPFAGHAESGAVRATTTSISAVIRSAQQGQTYRFALSRRSCRSLRLDPDSPLSIVGRSSAIHAEKNQDIEVENDETHFAGAPSARSTLLLGRKRSVRACGPGVGARHGVVASLDATAGSGVTAVAAASNRMRARVACSSAKVCRGLMEEEGIFYYVRQPCGKPAAVPSDGARIEPPRATRRGNVIELEDVLISNVRAARSLRIAVGDDELACGDVLR